MCVSSSFGGRLQPRSVFFHFIFRRSNCRPKRRVINLPKRSAAAESRLKIPAPSLVLFLVGCCVVSANGGRLKLRLGPSLYFFIAPFAAPNDRNKSSPRVPPRSRLITNAPPPPAAAELWLVVVSIEKTAATQDRHCEPKPGRRAPAVGS